jgi:hypothetical protein
MTKLGRLPSSGIHRLGRPPDRMSSYPRPPWLGSAFSHGFRRSSIDPGGGGSGKGHGHLVDESRRLLGERAVKRDLPGRVNSVHRPEMDLIRRHQSNPGRVRGAVAVRIWWSNKSHQHQVRRAISSSTTSALRASPTSPCCQSQHGAWPKTEYNRG